MTTRMVCGLGLFLGGVLCAVAGRAAEDPQQMAQRFGQLAQQFDTQLGANRFAEAEATVREMIPLAERISARRPDLLALCLHNLGIACAEQKKYDEALPAYQRALEIREKALGADHPDVADTVNNLANVYLHQRHYAAAEPLYQRAVAAKQKALGTDHPDTIELSNNLGILYHEQERLAEAEAVFRRVLAAREKRLPADHPDVAEGLNQLGSVCADRRKYDEAEALHRRALELREKALGKRHGDVAASAHNLAQVLAKTRRYQEAEIQYARALTIWENAPGGGDPRAAEAHNGLGNMHLENGRAVEAERCFRAALAMRQQQKPPDTLAVAYQTANVANALLKQGRYAEAEATARQALDAIQQTAGAGPALSVSVLNSLAVLYEDQGRFAEAETLLKRAVAALEREYGPESPALARAVGNLANIYNSQNRYAEARELYVRAVELKRKAFGRDDPEVAATLNAMGGLARRAGEHELAADFYRTALNIWHKAYGERHSDVGLGMLNLATTLAGLDRDAEAIELFEAARKTLEATLGPQHPDFGKCLCSFAAFYHQHKADARALPLVEQAVAVLDRAAPSPVSRFHAHFLHARILWNQQQPREALAALARALELAEEQRTRLSGGEQELAGYFAGFATAFETMVAWQSQQGDLAAALAAIERSRARTLLDQMDTQGADLLSGADPQEAAELRRRAGEAQRRIAAAQADWQAVAKRKELPGDERQRQAAALLAELEKATAAYAAAYADIRTASPAYRLAVGRDRQPVALAAVCDWAKQTNTLLIEYLAGREGCYAMVFRPGEAPRLERLEAGATQAQLLNIAAGPLTAARLDAVLRNEAGSGVLQLLRKPTARRNAALESRLATLYELLIPQAERTLLESGKCARLAIVPDGPLATLPFEALVAQAGDEPRYLLDVGPPIHYAPSATILLKLTPAADAPRARLAALTLGEPAYERAAGESRGAPAAARYALLGGSLESLPFSRRESDWIVGLLKDAGADVRQLVGGAANEAALRQQGPGRTLLHVACHGMVDQAHGNLFGALALSPGAPGSPPAQDGFLTLAELYELNLKGCELAVLSACETNCGPEQQGEGVWALSRGFLVAGARRVVASNWLVSDEAAASLVSYFCGGVAQAEKAGQPPDYAAALQAAKRWVRQQPKWQSPFYWAPFVMIGPS